LSAVALGGIATYSFASEGFNEDLTFEEFKEAQLERINSMTEEGFENMQEGRHGMPELDEDLTFEEFKEAQLERINSMTEEGFENMQEGRHGMSKIGSDNAQEKHPKGMF
jgi:hypothetical protein